MNLDSQQIGAVLAAAAGGQQRTSAQAGCIPIPLRSAPSSALRGLHIYLKASDVGGEGDGFVLYRAPDVSFTPEDRRRLMNNVRCVYIRTADHARFRSQAERSITAAVNDPTRALSERASLVYETSLELMNELLNEPDLEAHGERLTGLSRGVATLVLSSADSFGHLFQASHHDFYTATHMVNVGTWMVPLAHALGYADPEDLTRICQAGLLHDMGKIFVPPEVLNCKEKLSTEQWAQITRHPELGWQHLQGNAAIHQVVRDVCRQHHERMDGTGYPERLKGNQINRVARICAVVDAFDAMTALRPYKQHALSVSEAILTLRSETPAKYDPEIVAAWIKLLGRVSDQEAAATLPDENVTSAPGGLNRRRFKRFQCETRGTVHLLVPVPGGGWQEESGVPARVFDVSRFGLGLLTTVPVPRGRRVRIYLQSEQTAGRRGRRVVGEVMRCAPREDGGYEIGVQLFPHEPASAP